MEIRLKNGIIFTFLLYPSILLKCGVESANILVYGAIGTHSVRISMTPFMEALADKGHNVTFLSPFDNFKEFSNNASKIHYYTPQKWKHAMGSWDAVSVFQVRKLGINQKMMLSIHSKGIQACEVLYSDPEFVSWVQKETFDLVIVEAFVNECAYGLVDAFKAKLAIYTTTSMKPWFPDAHGFPDETSTLPEVVFDYFPGDRMTFFQRMKNSISPIVFHLKRDLFYFPVLEDITRKGLGLDGSYELPSFGEIEKNASLVFVTSHFTTDIPRSFPPHVVPVGGGVVGSKEIQPLSKEMEQFVASAKTGFVYISFGTVAEFTNFDKEVQQEFIKALYAFPQLKFVWKASVQINETLPENVMQAKWIPQQTILAHPKLKAFISHCGMGSITESIHFGIPLILVPIFADQDGNANAIEAKGAGIKLEITTLKGQELEHALNQVLSNDKYRTAMRKLSKSFKDRPVPPVENGVWWVDYILRHPNSNDYLVPLSVRQPWWQRRQIDVWISLGALFASVLIIILGLMFCIIKMIFKVIMGVDDKRANHVDNQLQEKKQK